MSQLKVRDIERLVERDIFSDYLPWFLYDQENGFFLNLDNTAGLIWECTPLPFCSMKQVNALESILQRDFPKGTVMQWILYPDHNIENYVESFLANKKRPDRLAQKTAEEYAKFLKAGTQGLSQTKGIPVRTFRLFVTIKSPDVIDLDELAVLEESMQGIGLNPKRWQAEDLLKWARQFFNGFDSECGGSFDPKVPLSKQIIDASNRIDFAARPAKIGKRFARCLTPKTTGDSIDPLMVNKMFGGIMGPNDDTSQITTPFLYCLTVIFDDAVMKIHNKASVTMSMQAVGSFSKALKRRLDEFGWALDKLATNEKFVQVIPTMWVFADTEESLRKSAARVERIWEAEVKFKAQVEDKIEPALFIMSLPFGFYNVGKNLDNLDRHFILPTSSVARLLPVQGDFQPSSIPIVPSIGRKGQIGGIDVFDKRANAHNFYIAAATGSGKSFWLNFLCSNYYAAGAKVRLVDIGYSYKKLALSTKQRFLDLDKEFVCMNPYDFKALDGEDNIRNLDTAVQVVAQMVYSSSGDPMPETEYSLIKLASHWAIEAGRQQQGIDAVYEYLKTYPKYDNQTEQIPQSIIDSAHGLAFNLSDFTSTGAYGKFFNGPSTFDISQDDLVVIELEGLRSKQELFSVVVMQMMNCVTQDLYLSDRATPRFIIFEEVATLLQQHGQQDFSRLGRIIEEGYRRARKYQGSFGVVFQSLLDMKNKFGSIGDVINTNAIFKFLLEGSDYRKAAREGIIEIDGLALDLLESVKKHNPHYSEMFVMSPFGMGVTRSIVDPWTYWVNTSSGHEVALFEALLNEGKTPFEAIQQLSGIT
ncbi:MAG: TraC family protein [Gammaproteobacteria bacterium]